MEILFQSYTAYSRYIERYDSFTSEEALAVVESHPPSSPPPATPPHLQREKKMRLRERECCTRFIFLFRVLVFRFCFYAPFLGFCTSISGFWVFVLYYGHQGKLSVFLKLFHDSILYFLILVLVLPFRNLCFCFGFWFSFLGFVVCIFLIGHHIFDRRLSVNLSTRANLNRLSISWQSR